MWLKQMGVSQFTVILFLGFIVITLSKLPFSISPPYTSGKDSQLINQDIEYINNINNKQEYWKAGINKRFDDITFGQAKRLLGVSSFSWGDNIPYPSKIKKNLESFPQEFDARKQWPGCVHPVLNQGDCGSCWAFGATEALSDRFCIRSNNSINIVLSPQYLVSCSPWWDPLNLGCDGGVTQTAWEIMSEGVPTLSCYPYTSGNDGTVPACDRNHCPNGQNWKVYKANNDTVETYIGEYEIQQALLKGPVEAAFMVFDDFMFYKSGVYVRQSLVPAGLHAIKMIGWGVDKKTGLKYWICQNSWGTDWGMDGFFWILRGDNECLIETDVVAGEPLL